MQRELNPWNKDEIQQQTRPAYATGAESNHGNIAWSRALSPTAHALVSCPRTQHSASTEAQIRTARSGAKRFKF